jgi:hypothetical protein
LPLAAFPLRQSRRRTCRTRRSPRCSGSTWQSARCSLLYAWRADHWWLHSITSHGRPGSLPRSRQRSSSMPPAFSIWLSCRDNCVTSRLRPSRARARSSPPASASVWRWPTADIGRSSRM